MVDTWVSDAGIVDVAEDIPDFPHAWSDGSRVEYAPVSSALLLGRREGGRGRGGGGGEAAWHDRSWRHLLFLEQGNDAEESCRPFLGNSLPAAISPAGGIFGCHSGLTDLPVSVGIRSRNVLLAVQQIRPYF